MNPQRKTAGDPEQNRGTDGGDQLSRRPVERLQPRTGAGTGPGKPGLQQPDANDEADQYRQCRSRRRTDPQNPEEGRGNRPQTDRSCRGKAGAGEGRQPDDPGEGPAGNEKYRGCHDKSEHTELSHGGHSRPCGRQCFHRLVDSHRPRDDRSRGHRADPSRDASPGPTTARSWPSSQAPVGADWMAGRHAGRHERGRPAAAVGYNDPSPGLTSCRVRDWTGEWIRFVGVLEVGRELSALGESGLPRPRGRRSTVDVVELVGRRVVLREVTAEDTADLVRIRRTAAVAAAWGDVDAEPDFPFEDPDATCFTICLGPAVVGMIQYSEDQTPRYRHAGIDLFVDPAVHGIGIGTDAVRTVAHYLIRERGHHRLVIDPAADNAAAIRCYARAGFRPVGLMRNYEQDADGVGWHDGLLMDLLAAELEQG